MSKQDIIYGAMYNEMVHESSHATLSLHWTKEGAEKAIELHKMEVLAEWKKKEKYWKNLDPDYEMVSKWDDFQDWFVKEFKIIE